MKAIVVKWSMSLASAALMLAARYPVNANVIHVPADYPTIQAAVNAAGSNDTIQIASGVYAGQVLISNKSLTLSGSPGTVLRATSGMS
jgi:pectin methylesterase-like acyl-CoA thioesterase